MTPDTIKQDNTANSKRIAKNTLLDTLCTHIVLDGNWILYDLYHIGGIWGN